jgi:hypothetical protein
LTALCRCRIWKICHLCLTFCFETLMNSLCEFSLWTCKRGGSPQWGVHTQNTKHQKLILPLIQTSQNYFNSPDHSPDDISSGEALVQPVHSVFIQFSLKSQDLPKLNSADLPWTCYIRDSVHQICPKWRRKRWGRQRHADLLRLGHPQSGRRRSLQSFC